MNGFPVPVPLLLALAAWILAAIAAWVDFRSFVLPDLLVLPFVALGLASFLWSGGQTWGSFLLCLAPSAALALLSGIASLLLGRETVGWGDVKLLVGLGFLLGPGFTVLALSAAAMTAVATLALLVLLKKKKWSDPVAFGFYLVPSALLVWLVGLSGGIRSLRF